MPQYPIAACTDCTAYLSDGTLPQDHGQPGAWSPADIAQVWGAAGEHAFTVDGADLGFHWGHCECCGSGFAGLRTRVIVTDDASEGTYVYRPGSWEAILDDHIPFR